MIGGEHLYLIQSFCTGAFKIGRSSDPKRRLRDLQVGSPYQLRLILVLEEQGWREYAVHDALQGYRTQGLNKGEWFAEPGLASLPDDIYERLDLDLVNSWWVTDESPKQVSMPVGRDQHVRARHTPLTSD